MNASPADFGYVKVAEVVKAGGSWRLFTDLRAGNKFAVQGDVLTLHTGAIYSYYGAGQQIYGAIHGRAALANHQNGDVLLNIEKIIGTDFDDLFYAKDAKTGFDGGKGHDIVDFSKTKAKVSYDPTTGEVAIGGEVIGLENIEVIRGSFGTINLGGRQTYIGTAATETFKGTGHYNILDYSQSNAPVSVNLTNNQVSGGFAQGDTISNMQAVRGSAFADRLIGGSGHVLDYSQSNAGIIFDFHSGNHSGGHAAGDRVSGFRSVMGTKYDDVFIASAAAERVNAGAGTDTMDYRHSDAGITMNFKTYSYSGGYAAGDALISIEIIGLTPHADTIIGDGQILVSYAAATGPVALDLTGGGASSNSGSNSGRGVGGQNSHNNWAAGDSFTDIGGIIGSSHGDVFKLGGKKAMIDGGAGTDSVDYSTAGKAIAAPLGLHVDLTASGAQASRSIALKAGAVGYYVAGTTSLAGNDRLFAVQKRASTLDAEWEVLAVGTLNIDHFYASYPAQGFKYIYLGSFNAGLTAFTASTHASASLFTFSTNNGVINGATVKWGQSLTAYQAFGDTLKNIETIIGTERDDWLSGNNQANVITGGKGDDVVLGGAGNDVLTGGTGKDYVDGGAGDDRIVAGGHGDVLIGGAGSDTLDLSAYNRGTQVTGVSLDLSQNQ